MVQQASNNKPAVRNSLLLIFDKHLKDFPDNVIKSSNDISLTTCRICGPASDVFCKDH